MRCDQMPRREWVDAYKPTAKLRFVLRSGKRILQQWYVSNYVGYEDYWRDVEVDEDQPK